MLVVGTNISLGHSCTRVSSARSAKRPRCGRLSIVAKRNTMSVQEYIDKHDLSKKVEEVINACVKAKPDEPISFMVLVVNLRH